MNLPLTIPNKRFLQFAMAVALLASASAAKAQLLIINDSDPSNVTITATGAGPDNSVTDATFGDGIDLIDFLTQPFSGTSGGTGGSSSTTLTTGDTSKGLTFDSWVYDSLQPGANSVSNVDINLFDSTTGGTATFTVGKPAFDGSITINLSGLSLPLDGATGSIYTGFDGSLTNSSPSGTSPNTEIGEWKVVNTVSAPEPSSWMLTCLAFGVVAFFRFVRNARSLRL